MGDRLGVDHGCAGTRVDEAGASQRRWNRFVVALEELLELGWDAQLHGNVWALPREKQCRVRLKLELYAKNGHGEVRIGGRECSQ
jgi:hypothetical protein